MMTLLKKSRELKDTSTLLNVRIANSKVSIRVTASTVIIKIPVPELKDMKKTTSKCAFTNSERLMFPYVEKRH